MIVKQDMFIRLLEVCPTFGKVLNALKEEWRDEPSGHPIYLALSGLAQHIIEMLEQDRVEEVTKALDLAEQWLLEGDRFVREAATVGLLEDLQNGVRYNAARGPDDIYELLRPECRRMWDELNRFWAQVELAARQRDAWREDSR